MSKTKDYLMDKEDEGPVICECGNPVEPKNNDPDWDICKSCEQARADHLYDCYKDSLLGL